MATGKKLKKYILYFVALFSVCFVSGMIISPISIEAAKKSAIVLEMKNGSQKTWKKGQDKLKIKAKNLKYIYFGNYPQTEIAGCNLTGSIVTAAYNSNGIASVKGVKYKRISKKDAAQVWNIESNKEHYYDWGTKEYAYFRIEPIKWRVLSYNKGRALVVAEYGLDTQPYNTSCKNITWAKSTLRSWLNKKFISAAFTSSEKKMIETTQLSNEGSRYKVSGGNSTKDKLFLLSLSDSINSKYGFSTDKDEYDEARRCAPSGYAKAMGAYQFILENSEWCRTKDGLAAGYWLLRTPGEEGSFVAYGGGYGYVYDRGVYVDQKVNLVRPAMYIDLSTVIR